MLKSLRKVSVFLSSPGDCKAERQLVKRVIEQINVDHGFRSGFVIELIAWETHAAPGAASYSQDVINKDVGSNFEIFIGFFKSRFGTGTGKHRSGTEEEYENAKEENRKGHRIEFMWYFFSGQIQIDSLDLAQIGLISEFKSKLRADGILYWSYPDETSLAFMLLTHIYKRVSDILEADSKLSRDAGSDAISSDSAIATGKQLESVVVDEAYFSNFSRLLIEDPGAAADVYLRRSTASLQKFSSILKEMSDRQNDVSRKMDLAIKKIRGGGVLSDRIQRAHTEINRIQVVFFDAGEYFQSQSERLSRLIVESTSDLQRAVLILRSLGRFAESERHFVTTNVELLEASISRGVVAMEGASIAFQKLGSDFDGAISQARVYSSIVSDLCVTFRGILDSLVALRNMLGES